MDKAFKIITVVITVATAAREVVRILSQNQ